MTPVPGTSLPERLRSLVFDMDPSTARDTISEAADELDRRAERIQRLTTGVAAMRLRGEMALRDEEQPPLDPETPGFRPGMTLTEDPTKMPKFRYIDPEQPHLGLTTDEEKTALWLIAAHPDGSITVKSG